MFVLSIGRKSYFGIKHIHIYPSIGVKINIGVGKTSLQKGVHIMQHNFMFLKKRCKSYYLVIPLNSKAK